MKKPASFRFAKNLFRGLNILAVIGLLASLIAGWLSPSAAPLFQAMGLLYPILLIVNLLFVVFWLVVRSRLWVLSFLFILLGYGNLMRNFGINFGDRPANGRATISLLTYNVQHFGLYASREKYEKIRTDIIDWLKNEESDIVCMQEYHGKGKTLYGPLQEMKVQLGALSYYYESYFNPRYQQLTGLVTISKYEAVNKDRLKFDGSRTFGIFTDLLIGGDTIRLFNIHLASIQLMPSDIDFVVNPAQDKEMGLHALKIYSKLSQAFLLRQRQAAFLTEKIKASPYPVILCGDFNDTPSSFVYREITGLLTDTFVEKGFGLGPTFAGGLPLLRIDFILKSDKFSTLSYRRHKVYFSDHFPVSAVLRFRESSSP